MIVLICFTITLILEQGLPEECGYPEQEECLKTKKPGRDYNI